LRLPLGLFLGFLPNFSDQPKQLLSGHAASLRSPVPDILGLVPREIASENLKQQPIVQMQENDENFTQFYLKK